MTHRASDDLELFRAADNHHPSAFVDITLGRSSKLSTRLSPMGHGLDLSTLTGRFRLFSFVYPLVLKIGLIELEGGPMSQRMVRFLNFAYKNWYFSAPAIAFAAICFSNATPRGVLKNLRSSDRNMALKGLRNAAWDLTYVTEWLEQVKSQDREKHLYVLCSCDNALRSVARGLWACPEVEEESVEPQLRDLLGSSAYEHYARLIASSGDPARTTKRPQLDLAEHKTNLIATLESQVLSRI